MDFTMTTGSIARGAGCTVPTVTTYANLGLVPCIRLENGTRLFRPDAVAKVREVMRARLAKKGRRVA